MYCIYFFSFIELYLVANGFVAILSEVMRARMRRPFRHYSSTFLDFIAKCRRYRLMEYISECTQLLSIKSHYVGLNISTNNRKLKIKRKSIAPGFILVFSSSQPQRDGSSINYSRSTNTFNQNGPKGTILINQVLFNQPAKSVYFHKILIKITDINCSPVQQLLQNR